MKNVYYSMFQSLITQIYAFILVIKYIKTKTKFKYLYSAFKFNRINPCLRILIHFDGKVNKKKILNESLAIHFKYFKITCNI